MDKEDMLGLSTRRSTSTMLRVANRFTGGLVGSRSNTKRDPEKIVITIDCGTMYSACIKLIIYCLQLIIEQLVSPIATSLRNVRLASAHY